MTERLRSRARLYENWYHTPRMSCTKRTVFCCTILKWYEANCRSRGRFSVKGILWNNKAGFEATTCITVTIVAPAMRYD